jgi:LPXTG-motif cell wall-anchored protein
VSYESLAFTGSDTLLVAGIGLAAAALGFGLVLVSRRRSVS